MTACCSWRRRTGHGRRMTALVLIDDQRADDPGGDDGGKRVLFPLAPGVGRSGQGEAEREGSNRGGSGGAEFEQHVFSPKWWTKVPTRGPERWFQCRARTAARQNRRAAIG